MSEQIPEDNTEEYSPSFSAQMEEPVHAADLSEGDLGQQPQTKIPYFLLPWRLLLFQGGLATFLLVIILSFTVTISLPALYLYAADTLYTNLNFKAPLDEIAAYFSPAILIILILPLIYSIIALPIRLIWNNQITSPGQFFKFIFSYYKSFLRLHTLNLLWRPWVIIMPLIAGYCFWKQLDPIVPHQKIKVLFQTGAILSILSIITYIYSVLHIAIIMLIDMNWIQAKSVLVDVLKISFKRIFLLTVLTLTPAFYFLFLWFHTAMFYYSIYYILFSFFFIESIALITLHLLECCEYLARREGTTFHYFLRQQQ